MKNLSHMLKLFMAAMFMLALCAVAQAQNDHSWVASTGNDANPCTRTSPCLTFAGAATKTNPRGQISAIDSGSYGFIFINKALTIDGGAGNVATIDTLVGDAIIVNAATADTVTIRNLNINGHETTNVGVRYISGGQLFLQNVNIERCDNGFFIKGADAGNPLRAEINSSRFQGNRVGLEIEDFTKVALRNSVITGTLHKAGPLSFGINMQPALGTQASLKLENNEISYCQSGLRAVGPDVGGGVSTFFPKNNHIYANFIGLNMTFGVQFQSIIPPFGTNQLSDNTIQIQGGIPIPAQQF